MILCLPTPRFALTERGDHVLKRYLAEFIATFILVFAGVGAIVADQSLQGSAVGFGLLGVALATGLGLAVAVAVTLRISGGHVNPAISIAQFIARRLSFTDLLGYLVAQLAGGTAAAFFAKRVLPHDIFTFASGAPALGQGVKAFSGTAIEVILTFFLAMAVWATAVDRKGMRNLAPFAIGLTVVFGNLIGGPFTGAAMNPARWFGPALAAGSIAKDWYVWVAGPILGALLGSLLYETFFMDEEDEVAVGSDEDLASDEDFEDSDESAFVETPAAAPTSSWEAPAPQTTSSYWSTPTPPAEPSTPSEPQGSSSWGGSSTESGGAQGGSEGEEPEKPSTPPAL